MARSGFVLGSLCAFLIAGAMPSQAAAQTAVPAPAAKVDFESDVMPILRANCIECHGPDKQRAGMRIDRKSSVLKPFSRRVVPGSSENSFLYHRIMGQYGAQMPPDGALKPAQIAIIKNWIDQGADWPDAFANEVDRPAPNAAAVAMVGSLRNDDIAAFMKSAAAQPSLLNERGPEGSTPFMYAVIYANTATLEQLLKMGADPNRKNDQGATALMWSARDLGKTRLLIDHGADVNAKSDDLRTPLMIAARKPGNSLVVKLLLEHGANPNANAKPETESSALLEALTAGDAASTELLVEHGANAKATGETGLDMAITNNCAKCLDLIVPMITDKDVYTAALQDNTVYGDMRSTQILLDHGADVKAYDPLGRTALMYAVVSDMLPLDEVKLLIDRGSDVNARDKHANAGDEGVTVLDIAKRNGDTPIVKLLLASGAKPGGATPVMLTPRVKNDIRLAIQDGIPLLQHADLNFATNSGCVSCHNNSLTAMTMGMLRKKGFAVDEKIDAEQVQVNAEGLAKLRDRMHEGMFVPVGDTFGDGVIAYMLLGLSRGGLQAGHQYRHGRDVHQVAPVSRRRVVCADLGHASSAVPGSHWRDCAGYARAAALYAEGRRRRVSRIDRAGRQLACGCALLQQRRPQLARSRIDVVWQPSGGTTKSHQGVACDAEGRWQLVRSAGDGEHRLRDGKEPGRVAHWRPSCH